MSAVKDSPNVNTLVRTCQAPTGVHVDKVMYLVWIAGHAEVGINNLLHKK